MAHPVTESKAAGNDRILGELPRNGSPKMSWGLRSAGADNKVRFNDDFLRVGRICSCSDAAEHGFCRDYSHFSQRLSDRCQGRILERRALYVVKTHDGDVFG